MNLHSVMFTLTGMIAGALTVFGWNQYSSTDRCEIDRHWGIINQFNTIMRDASPQHDFIQNGLFLTECPSAPELSLAFLVSKQELGYADLVFPKVTNSRDNNLRWLEFTKEHYPDIVSVVGHTNLGLFKTSGDYPLHLNVWYKNTERAKTAVKKLVELIESGTGDRTSTGACDFSGFVDAVKQVQAVRQERLLTAQQFAELCKDPKVVVLDARGESDFAALHVKGSKNLPFTSIGIKSLRELIPDTDTKILIYCRNNLANDVVQNLLPFIEKSPAGGLNIPTSVTLRTYGYQDVWELDEVVDPNDSPIEFVRAQ